jgi:tetratricopeptide (TPR) repeat protein
MDPFFLLPFWQIEVRHLPQPLDAPVWYLFKKGRSPEEIKSFFPADQGLGLASTVIDTLTDGSFGGLAKGILDLVSPHWSQRLQVWRTKFGISKEEIAGIIAQDLDTELIDTLPGYLATDLKEVMAQKDSPPRIVLFFDTHEAFWGENRDQPKETYFFRDEWLRRLLRNLDYDKGIVAMVAGRDQPRWAEAKTVKPNTDIPERYVQQRRVGNLSVSDALAYLQQPAVSITDKALCHSLITYASVEPGEVHPLHLGLCADVALEAQRQGTPLTAGEFFSVPDLADKSKLLVERLLKYVSEAVRDAIYALSACRAFDKDLYRQLGQVLNFASYDADFELITRFSFVKQLPEPRHQWYRLHRLLRRLNAEGGNERIVEAHRFLEQHYREMDQRAEAIYHANQLNPRQGTLEWILAFDEALKHNSYQNCEMLLEIRREIQLVSFFQLGLVSESEGDYYQSLARYEEAEQEYLEAILACEQSFKEEGHTVGALNNMGNTLLKLGDLQLRLSRYSYALRTYKQAILVYDGVLRVDSSHFQSLSNKGLVLQSLGRLYDELSRHSDALRSYQEAIAAYDRVLSNEPNDIEVLHNKGNSLQSIGRLQTGLSNYTDALENYQQAVEVYDEVLFHNPKDFYSLNHKGLALQNLGGLQALQSNYSDALDIIQRAITIYNEALHYAPDYLYALNNKGLALRSLAELQAEMSYPSEALSSYQQAVVAYDEVLTRAPDAVEALNNKGLTLQNLGKLQVRLLNYSDALNSYEQGILACNEALRHAPSYISALNNKGLLYVNLSQLQVALEQRTQALKSLQTALPCFLRSLEMAPEDAFIRDWQERIQAWLVELGEKDK